TLLSSSQAHSLPDNSIPQWTPSPVGYLKLNTDALVRTSELSSPLRTSSLCSRGTHSIHFY
ncbi:hypothetical protein PanWU01x14_025450, partial [Parasponia andersonii]